MKNLFDQDAAADLRRRLTTLRADSPREWGQMNLAQALAHTSAGIEMALGEQRFPRMMIGRLLGFVIKPLALGDDKPMRRNSPTVPAMVMVDERDLERERARLLALLDRFTSAGPAGCTDHPHAFFGRLTPDEWAVLMYKHVDHHLRQFGA